MRLWNVRNRRLRPRHIRWGHIRWRRDDYRRPHERAVVRAGTVSILEKRTNSPHEGRTEHHYQQPGQGRAFERIGDLGLLGLLRSRFIVYTCCMVIGRHGIRSKNGRRAAIKASLTWTHQYFGNSTVAQKRKPVKLGRQRRLYRSITVPAASV